MQRCGLCRPLSRVLTSTFLAASLTATRTSTRTLHTSTPRYQAAASSSSHTEEEAPKAGAEDGAGTQNTPNERVRLFTLGDYLRALPRGVRELLLYSPVLALLFFVLYQQKSYFRDPGEPWYAVLRPWRLRRVGGRLLEDVDAPLPQTSTTPATSAMVKRRISLCERDDVQAELNKCGAPAAGSPATMSPPIAPFSTLWTSTKDGPSSATPTMTTNNNLTEDTIWGKNVYAVRAVRKESEDNKETMGHAIVGYETVTVSSWESSREGGGWYARAMRFFAQLV